LTNSEPEYEEADNIGGISSGRLCASVMAFDRVKAVGGHSVGEGCSRRPGEKQAYKSGKL
jgi:hypothetical protein